MIDFEKDILKFDRKVRDEFSERIHRFIDRKRHRVIDTESDITSPASSVEIDTSGYVPDYQLVTSWALGVLPKGVWFASSSEKVEMALRQIQDMPFYDEIPELLIDWAQSADWDAEEGSLEAIAGGPKHEKFANFMDVLMGLVAANTTSIEGTIENIVAQQSPKDGEEWYSARITLAIAFAHICIAGTQEKIRNPSDGEEWVLFDELDNALQSVFEIGWLFRDYWWVFNHGEAASEYYARMDGWKAQDEGRKAGSRKTREKSELQRAKCAELVAVAVEQRGLSFAFASVEVQAQTLMELAERHRREEFIFRSDTLLSIGWFRERVEDMKATGEMVSIAEKAMGKA